jgi:hypothetical protein
MRLWFANLSKRDAALECFLLKGAVEKKLRAAVMAAVRTLVVQSPVVRKVFDLVFAARREISKGRWRVAPENFRNTARFFEVSFKPFKDAGDFNLLLLGKNLFRSPRASRAR